MKRIQTKKAVKNAAQNGVRATRICQVRDIRRISHRLALTVGMLALFGATAIAAPAPWYYWRSVSGDRICAQFTPGDGWAQDGGPYKDARCASRF